MMKDYYLELQEKYLPYSIMNQENRIVGFTDDIPIQAKKAAKEHILTIQKFDDVEMYNYYDELIKIRFRLKR